MTAKLSYGKTSEDGPEPLQKEYNSVSTNNRNGSQLNGQRQNLFGQILSQRPAGVIYDYKYAPKYHISNYQSGGGVRQETGKINGSVNDINQKRGVLHRRGDSSTLTQNNEIPANKVYSQPNTKTLLTKE